MTDKFKIVKKAPKPIITITTEKNVLFEFQNKKIEMSIEEFRRIVSDFNGALARFKKTQPRIAN